MPAVDYHPSTNGNCRSVPRGDPPTTARRQPVQRIRWTTPDGSRFNSAINPTLGGRPFNDVIKWSPEGSRLNVDINPLGVDEALASAPLPSMQYPHGYAATWKDRV